MRWLLPALFIALAACDTVSLEVLDPGDATSDQPVVDGGAEAEVDAGESGAPAPTGCVDLGGSCTFAGACCSLACFAPDGTTGTCVERPLCTVAGPPPGICSYKSDCCSNVCNSGTCGKTPGCFPAGELCAQNADCCGGSCQFSAIDQHLRCALLIGCRVSGEVCGSAGDCCYGSCVLGHCQGAPNCNAGDGKACTRVAWELCATDGECCSRRCLPTGEVMRCAPLGGCAPLCERCASNADCCSGACMAGPDLVKRCKPSGPCDMAGEVCANSPQCCSGTSCAVDPVSLDACRCESASACADAGSCAVGRDCCSNACIAQKCSATVPDGQRCSASADCENAPTSDCFELDGGLVCAPAVQ